MTETVFLVNQQAKRYQPGEDHTECHTNCSLSWFDGQIDIDSERLVFIDDAQTATNMTLSLVTPERRSMAHGLSARPSQDHNAGRGPLHDWYGHLDGVRRVDDWRRVR